MKKLILFLLLNLAFLLTVSNSFGQERQCSDLDECNQKLVQAAQMVNKLLEVKKADDKAVVDLQIQIASLQTTIAELKAQKTTPCSITQEKLKLDSLFWTNEYKASDQADKSYRKQIEKNLKQTRHLGAKAVQSACGFTEKSALEKVWNIISPLLPVAAVLLK